MGTADAPSWVRRAAGPAGSRERRFLRSFLQRCSDALHDSFAVLKDLSIFEAKGLHSQVHEEFRSAVISFDTEQAVMNFPIEFDNDAAFRTIKVDNVRTYAVLSVERFPVDLRLS